MSGREEQAGLGSDDTTEDAILGGQLRLRQPSKGYRTGIDPILLAAAAPASARALDLGCGTGAAALCLARRLPEVEVAGLEIQPGLAALAKENVRLNGLEARIRIHEGDLLQPPMLLSGDFDLVMANPPFHAAGQATAPADPGRARGHVEGAADLARWIGQALKLAGPRGHLLAIHRPERLGDFLALLEGRAGGITVFPLWPGSGRPARRILLLARKGSAAPLTLAAGLVLHEADGRYTAAADAVLRGAGLDLA
ncbi:MAG TPA: methyltransferase [Dongiaceae bacterium]